MEAVPVSPAAHQILLRNLLGGRNEGGNVHHEIAAAAGEQSASTNQVSASAEAMGARVVEMRSEADHLGSTAEALRQMVGRFKRASAAVPAVVTPLRKAA